MADISHHVTVVRDGLHNAFTDLQYWQGCYWVSYRKGADHVAMDGQSTVSVSSDRTRFREVARLKAPGDNRDPKLLPISEDKIALYSPSLTQDASTRNLQQFIRFSSNGFDWSDPQPILGPRKFLWRVRKHDGRYYALVYYVANGKPGGKGHPYRLDLMVSDDLIDWQLVSQIGEVAQALCESDIFWRPDGEAWVIARSETTRERAERGESQGDYFCTAKPPYTDWTVTEMSTRIHAAIFVEHHGAIYVAGRRFPQVEGDLPSHTTMGVWRVIDRDLDLVLRIPASDDCSYPGLIKDPDGRICLSYYSQHAYRMGVVARPFRPREGQPETPTVADVYFAELELP